jgi:hypothetical protein
LRRQAGRVVPFGSLICLTIAAAAVAARWRATLLQTTEGQRTSPDDEDSLRLVSHAISSLVVA